jgi:hypothetical protein
MIFFQVFNFVKLAELYYAASHGMDIMGPTKNRSAEKVRELFSLINFMLKNLSYFCSLCLAL